MVSVKKIYFASDFHLGSDYIEKSTARELKIVRWLDLIQKDASELYLLGDVFEFWFEYKNAIPKGFTRLLGKLAELSDHGIKIHYFTGNHDIWLLDYFKKEMNFEIYFKPVTKEILGKIFFLGHGDALGPGDFGGKFVNALMKNKIATWVFRKIHPDMGIPLGKYFSGLSGIHTKTIQEPFHKEDSESLINFSKSVLKNHKVDFFIFGHRHLALDIPIGEKTRYINLGDWIHLNSYGVYDGITFELKYFEKE